MVHSLPVELWGKVVAFLPPTTHTGNTSFKDRPIRTDRARGAVLLQDLRLVSKVVKAAVDAELVARFRKHVIPRIHDHHDQDDPAPFRRVDLTTLWEDPVTVLWTAAHVSSNGMTYKSIGFVECQNFCASHYRDAITYTARYIAATLQALCVPPVWFASSVFAGTVTEHLLRMDNKTGVVSRRSFGAIILGLDRFAIAMTFHGSMRAWRQAVAVETLNPAGGTSLPRSVSRGDKYVMSPTWFSGRHITEVMAIARGECWRTNPRVSLSRSRAAIKTRARERFIEEQIESTIVTPAIERIQRMMHDRKRRRVRSRERVRSQAVHVLGGQSVTSFVGE